MKDAYYVQQFIEDEIYRALIGPDNFMCLLTEPEDRLWERDLKPVVDRLNELHTKLQLALQLADLVDPYDLAPNHRRTYEQLFGKEVPSAK